jgi:glutamate/aspartate transport system substrate-binding protein
MNIISANGHPEAFQMVETGRAVAFVMDDILLYSLAAQSRTPATMRSRRSPSRWSRTGS